MSYPSDSSAIAKNLAFSSLKNNFEFDNSSFYAGYQGAHKSISNLQQIKPVYILKYVISGEGTLTINNRTHTVREGDVFILPKNITLSYSANESNPFSYYYIGIDGVQLDRFFQKLGLSADMPLKHYGSAEIKDCFETIFQQLKKHSLSANLRALAELYKLFHLLSLNDKQNGVAQKNTEFTYINYAIFYIKNNYNSDITIAELAEKLGINRSYFSDLFRKQTKFSPQEYLLRYRVTQSCKLLTQGEPVTTAGMKCGFNTPSNFSVQFKKIMGITPNEFRYRAQHDIAPLFDDL